ncbi:MAG: signal peptide peptidase SppA [Candidatus Micrarchaeia archaeon]
MRKQPHISTGSGMKTPQPQPIEHQAYLRPQKISLWRTLGLLLLIVFVALFLLNYILPSLGIGGCVGVIHIDGELLSMRGYGIVSSDDIINFINQAELRPDVKGIIIEIDSPGGSPVASKEIYSALKAADKPTVAYINEIGTSGSYYVALGADKIAANPLSITGSIGVRTTTYDLSSLLEKIGVNATVIKSGELKDIGDIYRPLTEEEKALLQGIIDELQKDFMDTVISEREGNPRFSASSIEAISDARILTGKQAYDMGLVDELGTKQEVRSALGRTLGLGDKPSLCYFRSEEGLIESMLSSVGRGIGEALSKNINIGAVKLEYT